MARKPAAPLVASMVTKPPRAQDGRGSPRKNTRYEAESDELDIVVTTQLPLGLVRRVDRAVVELGMRRKEVLAAALDAYLRRRDIV